MFIVEILSFVDFTGLDASCTGFPLWGASQIWIISIPSNFIPVVIMSASFTLEDSPAMKRRTETKYILTFNHR